MNLYGEKLSFCCFLIEKIPLIIRYVIIKVVNTLVTGFSMLHKERKKEIAICNGKKQQSEIVSSCRNMTASPVSNLYILPLSFYVWSG